MPARHTRELNVGLRPAAFAVATLDDEPMTVDHLLDHLRCSTSGSIASISSLTERTRSRYAEPRTTPDDDFDAWGGGAQPIARLTELRDLPETTC
jgi:hypothetical protein